MLRRVTLTVDNRLPLMTNCGESVTAVMNSRLCWIDILEPLDECRVKPKTIMILIGYQKFQRWTLISDGFIFNTKYIHLNLYYWVNWRFCLLHFETLAFNSALLQFRSKYLPSHLTEYGYYLPRVKLTSFREQKLLWKFMLSSIQSLLVVRVVGECWKPLSKW